METKNQIRERIRKNPHPEQVAAESGMSLATVYRHIKGMDLELIRCINALSKDNKEAVIKELARNHPADFAEWYGVSRQYIMKLQYD